LKKFTFAALAASGLTEQTHHRHQWEDSPQGYPQTPPYQWWNWHDEHADPALAQSWLSQVERGARSFDRVD
jgi:hypothetical protein